MTAKPAVTDAIRHEIEVRAYLIWENEGRPHGREKEHWARAEAEILAVHRLLKEKPPAKPKAAGKPAAAPKAEAKAAVKPAEEPKPKAKPKAKKPARKKS